MIYKYSVYISFYLVEPIVEYKLANPTSLVFGALKDMVFLPIALLPVTAALLAAKCTPQYASLQAGSRSFFWIQPQPVAVTELSTALSPDWL